MDFNETQTILKSRLTLKYLLPCLHFMWTLVNTVHFSASWFIFNVCRISLLPLASCHRIPDVERLWSGGVLLSLWAGRLAGVSVWMETNAISERQPIVLRMRGYWSSSQRRGERNEGGRNEGERNEGEAPILPASPLHSLPPGCRGIISQTLIPEELLLQLLDWILTSEWKSWGPCGWPWAEEGG